MSFQLILTQSPTENIKRILSEEVDFIQNQLLCEGDARHKAVHGSRKSFKRIRSVLRLIRGEIGEESYRQENEFYRDSSRLLAAVRDSYVQVKIFKQVIDGKNYAPDWCATVHEWLVTKHIAISTQKLDQEQVLDEVAQRMQNGRLRIQTLSIKNNNLTAFTGGLTRIYSQGQQQMHEAYQDGQSIEKFHHWRKRVKYLWHHIEILHPLQPELCIQLAADLHTIADHLGDAHDFAVLAELLETEGNHLLTNTDAIKLLNQLYEEQRRLERTIRPLAEQIYTPSPKQFVKQFNY